MTFYRPESEWQLPLPAFLEEDEFDFTLPHLQNLSESTPSLGVTPSLTSLERLTTEVEIVCWDGPYDPNNPMNWSWQRKWTATILVSCFTFISPFSSTMVTPVLDDISDDLNVTGSLKRQLIMAIFLLGYAQGPFVLAPLSEIFGRVLVLQWANLFYLAFNTAAGFCTTSTQMLAFRFLSGLCNGVLADIWSKEERGKGQTIYGMLTFMGPTLAPIVGAFISVHTSWRWVFWSTSIFDAFVQIAALLFLKESYAPRILAVQAKKLRKMTGNPNIRSKFDSPDKTLGRIMRKRLVLPLIMLFTHPAVQLPSLYRAFTYGIMYLILSTFNQVWEDVYDMKREIASLNYLSLCVGFMIGLQISHPLIDRLYSFFKTYYGREEGLPEWRVPPMVISGFLIPAGLVLYGWSAEYRLHWIVPNIGCAVLAMGLIIAFQSAQAYVVDAYSASYAASAAAVAAFMRTMCGFSFPLFAPAMYEALNLGWGNTMLAFISLIIAIISPILLWFYGAKIRSWSRTGLNGLE
ncbi:uncharacterized protein JN550_002615 [Neoarthrinium moseri]|uniref:uncharacterized protein n=1 Tax=Neoarthrinium moseri TaxID=1658444 RepID=UPI001FDB0CB2|nr:uncharacterized protein JN550_002615 [Neoarthrinium moseri]KAI1874036.1 hypothetical protein JN550_002615 [Neoarthrinium moseri]